VTVRFITASRFTAHPAIRRRPVAEEHMLRVGRETKWCMTRGPTYSPCCLTPKSLPAPRWTATFGL